MAAAKAITKSNLSDNGNGFVKYEDTCTKKRGGIKSTLCERYFSVFDHESLLQSYDLNGCWLDNISRIFCIIP